MHTLYWLSVSVALIWRFRFVGISSYAVFTLTLFAAITEFTKGPVALGYRNLSGSTNFCQHNFCITKVLLHKHGRTDYMMTDVFCTGKFNQTSLLWVNLIHFKSGTRLKAPK